MMSIDWKNWGAVRIIRLAFGVLGATAFVMSHDPIFLLIAVVLLLQAIFNSTCGIGGCGYPQYKQTKTTATPHINNTTFEEIK